MACLDNIRGEMFGAKRVAPHIQWELAVRWLDKMYEDTRFHGYGTAYESLSHCLSSITTIGQRAMESLIKEGLL